MLPADGHVHTEFSWDTTDGAMEATCARALEIGLPAVAFTDHLDTTPWRPQPWDLEANPAVAASTGADGRLVPPPFDVDGYLETLEACRQRFPTLRILSGVEFGEPHRNLAAVEPILTAGRFERVLGSLHSLPLDGGFVEPPGLYARMPAVEVMVAYLAEVVCMVESTDAFDVLTHIDYALRSRPAEAGPFDPRELEAEFRRALRALAATGKALEVNTRLPLHPVILGWWHEEGGPAIAFGSDAHAPERLALGLEAAASTASSVGFRAGSDPGGFWVRS